MSTLIKTGTFFLVGAIACVELYLLCKYYVVSGTLRKMRNQSSGEHRRYKSEKKAQSRV